MSPFSPIRPRLPIRVVLSSTALLSYTALWKGAALAIAELGVTAFFLAGLTASLLGGWSAWFVLGAVLLAAFVRAIDIESWGLLIPGGLTGAVRQSFGARAANVASASALAERLLLAALAAVVVAQYVVGVAVSTFAGRQLTGFVRPEDLATIVAVFVIGLLWLQVRLGRHVAPDAIAKGIWAGIAILVAFSAWGGVSLIAGGGNGARSLLALPAAARSTASSVLGTVLLVALGVGLTLPTLGSGEAFARSAHEFAPPRIQVLRRLRRLTVFFGLIVTTMSALLFVVLIP